MAGVLRSFLRLSLLYFLVMVGLILVLRDNPLQYFVNMMLVPLAHWSALQALLPYLAALVLLFLLLSRLKLSLDMLRNLVLAAFASLLIAYSFGALKASLPQVFPFYADRFFADVDRQLHFGTDPWVLTHALSSFIPTGLATTFYLTIWSIPAFVFPMFLVLVDRDPARVSRFLLLYLLTWIGLGNVLALAGLSVGPVYFDRYMGGTEFAGLTEALNTNQVSSTIFGMIQQDLWHFLIDRNQEIGTGISAFPSVHVGIATVIALYGIERGLIWAIPGVLFCAIILFLSVYLGWHYAVDGYFSILFLTGIWRLRCHLPFNAADPAV